MTQAHTSSPLLKTPLFDLHLELGARMVPFAGYEMPVQYPAGLIAEHKHTRSHASLFDVSHMGQLSISGAGAAQALERLIPVDIVGLGLHHQRYGLLLNEQGGIIDDLMIINRGDDILIAINASSKTEKIAHMQKHMGNNCKIEYLSSHALLALQGPQAINVIQRIADKPIKLFFMQGNWFKLGDMDCYVTRSGYTGEDGFEISIPTLHAVTLARLLLSQPEVLPAGLGARNSLRLEAGLCLYGNDINSTTTPSEAKLNWAIQKVRRTGGARAAGFPGAEHALAQINQTSPPTRQLVALISSERVPVRDGTTLHDTSGQQIGIVTSGLYSPTCECPIALGYLPTASSGVGTTVNALVRGKNVPMQVKNTPFVPHRYQRE